MTRIPTLDGWRGVAILLVLIDHASELTHSALLHKVTRVGATGVGLFFALSGFLITSRLLEEQRCTGAIRLSKFYVRRIFRLLPPTLVYLTVLSILTALGIIAATREQLYSSLFFYRNYIPAGIESSGWFTAHFWSLNVEEHFYLIWPALLLLTRRRIFVPVALAVSVATWRYFAWHYQIFHTDLWFPGRTDVRLDSLLWGCILALVICDTEARAWLARHYTAAVFFLFAAIDAVSNLIHGKHDYSPYEPMILALIVLWPILRPTSALSILLEWEPLKWVGRLSYSLYIWQQLWLLYPGVPAPFGRWQHAPLNLISVLITAALSYFCIEKPMIHLGHRLTRRRETREIGEVVTLQNAQPLL